MISKLHVQKCAPNNSYNSRELEIITIPSLDDYGN